MTVEGPVELGDPATLKEIAGRVLGNVRRLQGAMTRVAAFSSMLSEPVTPSLARRALDSPAAAEPPPPRRPRSHAADGARVRRDPGGHLLRLRRLPTRPALTEAELADLPRSPARHVPGPARDLALARPDRSRVQPRPQHGSPRHSHGRRTPRAGIRHGCQSPPHAANCSPSTAARSRPRRQLSTRRPASPTSPSTTLHPAIPCHEPSLLHSRPPPLIHLRQIGRCKIPR